MASSKRRRVSSIEREIDKAVEAWCVAGLVERTGWREAPLISTPLPYKRGGIYFDADDVQHVLEFFRLLNQQIGRWAGKPFVLLDWQVRWIIAPAFGVKRADGLRLIRTVWVEIPRKNGKSTLCSGLGLCLFTADREAGAEVYAAAGDKPQAGIVFRAARSMAEGSPEIKDRLGKRGIQRNLLENPHTHSIFRVLSADGDRQHGLNVHGAVIDEVHVHKNADLIDALETGTGSREQPLIVFITTADEGTDGSVYSTKREYLEGVASGTIIDPSFYGIVFGADKDADGFDPFSDETIRAANPGAGITVLMDYLRAKANEARQSPAQLNRYLRLHLNVRTKQETRWLALDNWDAAAGIVTDEEWRGKVVRCGLDLSSTTDFTAFVMLARDADRGHPIRALFWLPEERVDDLAKRTAMPLKRWAAQGWLKLTEGNVVDYAKVRADITAEVDRLGVTVGSVGYDPWNASETVQKLEEEGYSMVPVRQGYGTLSMPTKQLEALVYGSTPERPMIRHGGNPILRWMIDCVAVRSDDNGNIKPVKPDRMKSGKRIDGVVALVMAEREDMFGEEPEESSAGNYIAALMAQRAAAQT